MAERYAVATGNWSAVGTWDGGASLPGVGDTVHANGFTVTINQAIAVVKITTAAGAVAVAGGGFLLGGNFNVTADVQAGSSTCLTSANRSFTLTGNITGAATGSSQHGVNFTGSGTVIINGNTIGGANGNNRGINCSATVTLTITGNVTGGSALAAYGILIASTAVVSITGTVTGGSIATAAGADVASTAAVTITGNAVGDVAVGVDYKGSTFLTLNGKARSSTTQPGVTTSTTGHIRLVGTEYASNGHSPTSGLIFFLDTATATVKVYEAGGDTATLSAAAVGFSLSRTVN